MKEVDFDALRRSEAERFSGGQFRLAVESLDVARRDGDPESRRPCPLAEALEAERGGFRPTLSNRPPELLLILRGRHSREAAKDPSEVALGRKPEIEGDAGKRRVGFECCERLPNPPPIYEAAHTQAGRLPELSREMTR